MPPRPRGPIGVLALQGSFALHAAALERLGVPVRLVRSGADLDGLAGLVFPGGESTVHSKLLERGGIFERVRALARGGLPCFGTCAGAILLGRGEGIPPRLEASRVRLLRNAYGAQVDSFSADVRLEIFAEPFHAIFIRAPIIETPLPAGVRALGALEGPIGGEGAGSAPILVRDGSLLLATFHPELTEDLRLHAYFLAMCAGEEPAPGVR